MSARAAIRHIRWRLRIWAGVAIALGAVLCFIPLFGVLGYELAFAMAIVGSICGLDVGAAYARALAAQPPAPSTAGLTLVRGAAVGAGLAVGIVVIPAVICAIHGLWAPTCDWTFGVWAYLVMPVFSTALAAGIGHAIGTLVRRRFLGAACAILPLFVMLGVALLRFYGAPAVFNYTPIVGYFPGNLYDEDLHLGATLLWSRLEQLAWVVAILALVAARLDAPTYRVALHPRPLGRRIPALAIAAASTLAALILFYESGDLGYRVDADDVVAELDGRIETAHFVIHYAHTPEIDRDIQLIAEDHEFRLAEVAATLGVWPSKKLVSYYFADKDQKARLMGARDVEMAKPWRGEIYLDHRGWPEPSLRHEIAHAVAAEFGDWIFHVASRRVLGLPILASPGLIEGLAVATDWPGNYDRPTPHESVRALEAMGVTPTIRELLSLKFFGVSSARGYTTAGSFLRFLLDTYGAPKLRALYGSGGDFEDAYGKDAATLEKEWQAMIQTLPAVDVEASRERFRGVSVFDRPCPHAIAARQEKALAARAAGEVDHAIDLMRHVCDDAPEEPRYRLALAAMLEAGTPAQKAEAEAIYTQIAHDAEHVTSSLRLDAYEHLAATAVDKRTLIIAAQALPVDEAERRQVDAKRFVLDRDTPAGAALRMYFFGRGADPKLWAMLASITEPELGFAHYLYGLQLRVATDWAGAADELARALQLGLPPGGFTKFAARQLAIAAYRAHRDDLVQVAIATLSTLTASDRLLAQDWAKRLTFRR